MSPAHRRVRCLPRAGRSRDRGTCPHDAAASSRPNDLPHFGLDLSGQCSCTPIESSIRWKSASKVGELRTAREPARWLRQYAAKAPAASPTFHSTGWSR
jgi:hypothetical protein